jgi:hypothetical protein
MAALIRVECVNKSDRYNPHERIWYIGGRNADGTRWKLSIRDAIGGVKQGKWLFFVERPDGHRARVIIAVSPYGNEYLKTETDGEHPNNLLSLPECP